MRSNIKFTLCIGRKLLVRCDTYCRPSVSSALRSLHPSLLVSLAQEMLLNCKAIFSSRQWVTKDSHIHKASQWLEVNDLCLASTRSVVKTVDGSDHRWSHQSVSDTISSIANSVSHFAFHDQSLAIRMFADLALTGEAVVSSGALGSGLGFAAIKRNCVMNNVFVFCVHSMTESVLSVLAFARNAC